MLRFDFTKILIALEINLSKQTSKECEDYAFYALKYYTFLSGNYSPN